MQKIYNDLKNEIKILNARKDDLEYSKNECENLINKKSKIIEEIENTLKELSGIENRLYYYTVVKGLNVTKAVDKVSFDFDLDPSTIWKNYYPKVKKNIKKSSEIQVKSGIS